MMKKTLVFVSLSAVLLLSSCVTTTKTARVVETKSSINNATVADLRVANQRVSYTMTPSKEIQRGGLDNVKQAALQEALTKNGNADVMVEPEYVVSMKKNFMSSKKVKSITVTGRPAYYENFRTLDDSVWATPGFYGQPNVVYVGKSIISENDSKRGKLALFGGLFKRKSDENYSAVVDNSLRRTGMGLSLNLFGGYQHTKTHFDYYAKYSYGSVYKRLSHSDEAGFLGVLATVGLQTDSQLWLGLGSGYFHGWAGIIDDSVLDENAEFVPLYGNVRYYFLPKKSSFFVDGKFGGSFEVTHNYEGGAMFGVALGYSVGSFEIAAQYMYQKVGLNDDYGVQGWKSYTDLVGISLGLKF